MKRTFAQANCSSDEEPVVAVSNPQNSLDSPTILASSSARTSVMSRRDGQIADKKHRSGSRMKHIRHSSPMARQLLGSPGTESALEKPINRCFLPNASIVLIGFRGSGKSTLGLIASSHLRRRFVDADQYWEAATGLSRVEFMRSHSSNKHPRYGAQVLKKMLEEHGTGCVIVWGAGCVESFEQRILQEFARTHPVIHVHREPEQIAKYLQSKDIAHLSHVLEICKPWYMTCSNFEFFNITERGLSNYIETKEDDCVPLQKPSTSTFLKLKRTEQNFLSFLSRIVDINSLGLTSFRLLTHTARPELRSFTYALTVLHSSDPPINVSDDDLQYSMDAYELKVDPQLSWPGENVIALTSSMRDSISNHFAQMKRSYSKPVIYHAELGPGGAITQLYLDLIHHGLRLSPDYLTVDLRCTREAIQSIRNACGSTKIIGHFRDSEPGQDGWSSADRLNKYLGAWEAGCDLVRLVQPAVSANDNIGVLQFHRMIRDFARPHPPLIAYNTGLLGRTSTLWNEVLTPVIQPDSGQDQSDWTMITARDAQNGLYSSFILHKLQFCVIGANVAHNLTPAMHLAAFQAWGISHTWKLHGSSSLSDLDELIKNQEFGGASITLPYKSEIIPLLHSISPAAKVIGAVNTLLPLRFEPDPNIPCHFDPRLRRNQAGPIKALYGLNTDWIGFQECICRNLSPANAINYKTTGLVIGAGGMARAAVYAMLHVGIKNIAIYNRTLSRAQQVAQHYNAIASSIDTPDMVELTSTSMAEKSTKREANVVVVESIDDPWPADWFLPTVIISTLPAYGLGNSAAPNITLPEEWLQSSTGGVYIEFAYESKKSPLLCQILAKVEKGWVVVDGLDLLPEQGFAQFELLSGRVAPRRVMRTEALRAYMSKAPQSEQADIEKRLRNLEGNFGWE